MSLKVFDLRGFTVIKKPVTLPAMTRMSKLWSNFFQGINWNIIKSTINEKILFHPKIVFLCRKPKQYIQKVVSGLLGSYVLETTEWRKIHKNIQSKSVFFFVIFLTI